MAAPDFSRTKNALIGCFGVAAVAFAGLFVTLQQRTPARPVVTTACVVWDERLRPVLAGDSARLDIRSIENGSDCASKPVMGFTWTTSDTAIIELASDGLVRGKRPGLFAATAQNGKDTLRTDGFVLPPEWVARIHPESATVRVGDSVRMVMRAFDKSGAPLPKVPFGIYTPEFFDPTTPRKPIVNRASWQSVLDTIVLVATDTGTTILVGRIGFQQVAARLVVRPRT